MAMLFYRGEHFDSNFFYYSGVDIDHAVFLSEPRTLFVPRLNFTLAKKLFKGRVVSYSDLSEQLRPLVNHRKLLVDFRSMPTSVYKRLSRFAKLSDFSESFLNERKRKKQSELALILKAVKATKKIFSEINPSDFERENDLRKYLLSRTTDLGLEPAFDPIVAADPNSRFPHYQSGSNSRIKEMVLVDYGVKFGHYCSDLTRCFFIKKGSEAERNYSVLKDMFDEIIEALPTLHSGKELAVFVETLYKRKSLPHPPHSIGHGIGLDVHEFPRLSRKFSDTLSGAALAIEPAVYFTNYGLRFEETVYFDGKKVRVF